MSCPYGKVLREYTNSPTEKYLSTQHERDTETGLDYRGARFYDSDVIRFLSVDPLAADYVAWSPYNYVLGNPLMFVDPDGRSVSTTIVETNDDGTYTVVDWCDDGSTDVILDDGTKVGESLTTHSFVDEQNNAVIGAVIDSKSYEGQNFIDNKIIRDNPNVFFYKKMLNLTNTLIINPEI